MKSYLKYALYGIAGIIVLALALATYFAITFNPNDYKQQIIDLVKEKKERTLHIDGDIQLSFWPKLGADLGKISISEHQSEKEFASVNSVKVALAVMPLLKKELVVDTVYVDGAKANIIKYKDGTTNFDDLLNKDDSESQDIKFDIQGINVSNSEVTYLDEATEANYKISKFNLQSGHIALAEPFDLDTSFNLVSSKPIMNADITVKGNFFADPDAKHYIIKNLDSHIQGDMANGKDVDITASGNVDAKAETMEMVVDHLKLVASGNFDGAKNVINLDAPAINILKEQVNSDKVTISLTQTKADADLKVNMVLADMKGSPKAIQSSGISGDVSMIQGKRTVAGKFASPFSANIENLIFDIPKLVGNLAIKDPSLPQGEAKGTFSLSAYADIKKEQAKSKFNLAIYETKLNGDVAVSGFKQQNITFNLIADKLNLNQLLGKSTTSTAKKESGSNKPADMSVLKNMNVDGKVNIGSIIYDKYRVSGLNVGVKANGDKLALHGLNVKFDDSQIKGAFSISQFAKPLYTFDLDIDQLNLDKYVTKSEQTTKTATKNSGNETLDLSALKALNATGSIRIGKLNYGKTKVSNVRIDLKANDGVATLAPLSANLYEGSMSGALKVDARNTPNIDFQQSMKGVSVGPLLSDTINNDMLSGTGTVNIDVSTKGDTINALKKSLMGNASLNLADGAIKGIDIAGSVRDLKNKVNLFKGQSAVDADKTKKTDFSELTASFDIKNGVAHNEDLAMKAPILRLAKGDSKGDIDIGNEKINYTAKPTIVKSLKGQGGADLDELSGIPIPIKITGTFTNPKFGMDMAALTTGLAKSKMLEKIGGEKGAAVQELIGGENKADALKGLLNKKKSTDTTAPAGSSDTTTSTDPAAPAEKPKSLKDQAKEEALKKLFKF
ncbi:MAG: AsmA family protein [Methylophilus sp.]